jgi:Protein of unknown function (DUF3365)
MLKLKRFFAHLSCLFILFFLTSLAVAESLSSPEPKTIPAHRAADYIHAVIETDRTIYSQYIVERLGETVSLKASENWKKLNTLPLPAQFLMMSSKIVNSKNLGIKYRLMSLWPINKNNASKTREEKEGLTKVTLNPKQPHTWIVNKNGQVIFNAVYPDLAVTKSCAQCHNAHPKSPKRDFKRNDVMGGIHISFPISKIKKASAQKNLEVAPEVVADYVHAILEADRTVYAKNIVNRLQKKNVIYASENWWEENTLLLPAQFLLNASDLIKNMRLGLDYKLISLWPINPHNGAANKFERNGLELVASQPLRPYIGTIQVENLSYFQAVYPDFAVTPACVTCHNAHPKSPKHDFKLHDVIGGIVVSVPTGSN